ncbi:hypothetical protein SAMN05192551_11351 [Tindallia magadiensis]|uniref:Uncharacterized protein n=1 Tax=Tindallia magadiensis TaxID=69895 RepID=A0A1I3HJX5_9FIRM|nr:hypothetical protein SAMN05192551_11351 [Tindallia magadiensis]
MKDNMKILHKIKIYKEEKSVKKVLVKVLDKRRYFVDTSA